MPTWLINKKFSSDSFENCGEKKCHFSVVVYFINLIYPYKLHSSGDILQASDDLSHVINSYKKIVEGQTINGETDEAQQTRSAVKKGAF